MAGMLCFRCWPNILVLTVMLSAVCVMMVELLEHKFWVVQLRKRECDQQMINNAMHKLHTQSTALLFRCWQKLHKLLDKYWHAPRQ